MSLTSIQLTHRECDDTLGLVRPGFKVVMQMVEGKQELLV